MVLEGGRRTHPTQDLSRALSLSALSVDVARRGLIVTLHNLILGMGDTYDAMEEHETAIKHYKLSLSFLKQLDETGGDDEAVLCDKLARSYTRNLEERKAPRWRDRAASIRTRRKERRKVGWVGWHAL